MDEPSTRCTPDGAPDPAPEAKLGRARDGARNEVGLSIALALQAGIMFVLAPLAATRNMPPAVLEVFRIALAAAAVLAVTRRRSTALGIGALLLVSILLSVTLRHGLAADVGYLIGVGAASVFDLAILAVVARVAFAPGRVSVHRIMGGVILYLSIGLIFANAYRAAAVSLHPSFTGLPPDRHAALSQLLYFSLTTLTTTGYGDIAPLHPFVRSLANLEAVIGQLFPATLLARLVTLHAAERER